MRRAKQLNALNTSASQELSSVFDWIDQEPSLSVAILTGSGRAFCVGTDLQEWMNRMDAAAQQGQDMINTGPGNARGATPVSTMHSKKPIIAAVNGIAVGAGFEMAINCDIVIASETATFTLPEGRLGVSPNGLCLPRLVRLIGIQRASELALTGKGIPASLAKEWGLVNKVVPQSDVVAEAIRWASEIVRNNSPDSIVCTRAFLRHGWTNADEMDAKDIDREEWKQLQLGANMAEGLRAYSNKRKPVWKPSRL